MTTANDDDWEKADISLLALKIVSFLCQILYQHHGDNIYLLFAKFLFAFSHYLGSGETVCAKVGE